MPALLPADAREAMSWGWDDFAPYYAELAERELTEATLPQWLKDWTEVRSVLGEIESRLNVATTVNTADQAAEDALLAFARTIAEQRSPAEQALREKLLASGLSTPAIAHELAVQRGVAEVYREENVARETRLTELSTEFDKLSGAQTVQWEGEEVPLTKLAPALEDPNRETREKAWRLKHERILADREGYNALWRQMHAVRQEMAAAAGLPSFLEFQWKQYGRLDYTAQDCAQFRSAIEEVVVPAANRIYARRAGLLGLDRLRPWDVDTNPYSQAPLAPYQAEADLMAKTEAVFGALDPQLKAWFVQMKEEGLMDLFGRKNKAGGGYCTAFQRAKRPFIFMNAVGTHDDLQTLLHEAGHCFHAYECFGKDTFLEAEPPIEFCEVASMGMEMLCQPHLERYYSPKEAALAQVQHLERCLLFWPFMASVDEFQHWCYSSKDGGDPAACDAAWREVWRKYMPAVDYTGLGAVEETGWHRKLHIFQVPLYYVEYGLAQVGAFQVWLNARKDEAKAVQMYKAGLQLGSTTGLAGLFAAAGGRFAFDSGTLGELVAGAESRVNELLETAQA